MNLRIIKLGIFFSICMLISGCNLLDSTTGGVFNAIGLSDTAVVIAKTAQIRTSYAVVAADLLEVKRGDELDVLDQVEFEKVLWYRVRARDQEETEGWIEAQNIITKETLEKSRALAEGFKDQPSQASGKLRAASNLRLAAQMDTENVLYRLGNGSVFEIITWKFVPKQQVSDVDDSKGETVAILPSDNEEIEAAKESGEPERLDEKYDIWYLVKLDPSVSPAPAGWIFGRQVELQVPNDIVFFQQNNRKFVTWHRLDNESSSSVGSDRKSLPGSWLVLTRTNVSKPVDGVEPDFDGILVLAFDKYDQSYYTAWRSTGEVWGSLPLRVEGQGDNKTFTVKLRHNDGRSEDKRFIVFRDKNRLRITPPEDIAQFQSTPPRRRR